MLSEETGDIFQKRSEGHWIVIPTNGTVKKDGTCVMGRGLALAIKSRYEELPVLLGTQISNEGNQVYVWAEYGIVTFPVKHNWWEEADLKLIEKSCKELVGCIIRYFNDTTALLYIPRVGCGNGKLSWDVVKPVLEKELESVSNKICLISYGE